MTEHPSPVWAQPRKRLGRLIGVGLVACIVGHGAAGAPGTAGTVAMTPPSCETYEATRPRGDDFEQLSDLFGLSIYRWEEADYTRYQDFLLACERNLPNLRGDVPADAWESTVAKSVAGLKEYAGYGQGRPRTQLPPDTPDFTPTFRTNGLEPAPGRSCIFTADWSSGQRGMVVITQRKNSFGDDLIEVRPFER